MIAVSIPNHLTRHKLKDLMSIWPENGVFFAKWLKKKGYSSELLRHYVKYQWIKQITKGVYARFQDDPTWEGVINALQCQAGSFIYIGGKSALELHGFIQYLPLKLRTVHLFTPINVSFPKWLISQKINDVRFIHYSSDVFSKNQKLGLTEIKVSAFNLKVSTPERAILEMIHNVPKHQSFIEVSEIFEFLNSLRYDLINELLLNCKSIKIKRIFLFLSEYHNHSWWDKVNKKIDVGKGKRLIEKKGVLDKKYLITVPHELSKKENNYEE